MNRPNTFIRIVKRFFISAFVVVTFIAYALEKKVSPQATASAIPTAGAQPAITATTAVPVTGITAPATTVPPAPTAPVSGSGYRDGTYTGQSVDVNWGLVQVQTTIQGGRIANVQFLQYPSDRRTSQRINSFAVPQLEQEAIQAQSANVDIVTGATLTSEGFQQSLQDALSQARG